MASSLFSSKSPSTFVERPRHGPDVTETQSFSTTTLDQKLIVRKVRPDFLTKVQTTPKRRRDHFSSPTNQSRLVWIHSCLLNHIAYDNSHRNNDIIIGVIITPNVHLAILIPSSPTVPGTILIPRVYSSKQHMRSFCQNMNWTQFTSTPIPCTGLLHNA